MDPEPGEEIFFHGHPSRRLQAGFYMAGLVVSLTVGVIVGVTSRIADHRVGVGLVIIAVVAVFLVAIAIGQLRRLQTSYSITSRRLTIEHGVLSKQLQQTRLERIQSVTCHQTLRERVLRIGTVEFDTAAEAEFDFLFHGVDDPGGIVQTVDRALHRLDVGPGA